MENILEIIDLEKEGCINLQDVHGNNVLHVLFLQCNIEIDVVKKLLDYGIDVNSKNKFGYPPLHHAVNNPNCSLDVVKLLLDRGAAINQQDCFGNSALHLILNKNADYDAVDNLIDHGGNVNHSNNDGDTPLHHILKNSKSILFPNGCDFDDNAVYRPDVLELLLDREADVNLKNNFGDSPLHSAVNNCDNKRDVVRLLLCCGANVFSCNYCGESPLHRAISSCDIDSSVVRCLLDFGAEVNRVNNCGDNPLHMGVRNPSCTREILKMLLDKGANLLTCTSSGEFPLSRAVLEYQTNDCMVECVQLLIKYTLVSSLGFNLPQILKSSKNFSQLSKFSTECVLEILLMGQVIVGTNDHEGIEGYPVTLYEFLRGYQLLPSLAANKKKEVNKSLTMKKICDPRIQIDFIINILHEGRFPKYHEVIASKVKRKDMLEKLKTLIVHTAKKANGPHFNKVIYLDCYSVLHIADYLLNEDLLHLIVAFQFAAAPPACLVGHSTPTDNTKKRAGEEVGDGDMKRVKINYKEREKSCVREKALVSRRERLHVNKRFKS